MQKSHWVLTGCLLLASLAASANQPLEKITVTDTNNFRLGREYTGLNIPESVKNPGYDGLRSYYQLPNKGKNELQDFLAIAKWVHLRWTMPKALLRPAPRACQLAPSHRAMRCAVPPPICVNEPIA